MRLFLLLVLATCASASAQTIHSPVVPDTVEARAVRPPPLTVRVTGGLGALALGQAADFHEAIADGYRGAGVPVPTQRSFAPGPQAGVEVLVGAREVQFGVGLRYAHTSATSLYGDYAGTLDLVSTVSAVFVEAVSVVELRKTGRVRPFVGTRGGTVYALASTRQDIDLGEVGASRSRIGGHGTGYSFEGVGGIAADAGPVGVFVQAGYRLARVGSLTGSTEIDGQAVEEGQLPYALDLSGWTGVVGLTLRR